MYRCIQGGQPRSIVFELLVIGGLGIIVLALQIDASKKFDCVIHEMWDVTCVLAQVEERTARTVDKPAAGQGDAMQGTTPYGKSMSEDERTT